MNIVIDSNILFSALIRESMVRRIIFEYDGFFLFPSFIFEEMEKHKQELLRKSCLDQEEFGTLLGLILEKVVIIPNEALLPYRKEAVEAVKDIDPDDAVFIACVLANPPCILWSNDKRLKELKRIRVLDTQDIIDFVL